MNMRRAMPSICSGRLHHNVTVKAAWILEYSGKPGNRAWRSNAPFPYMHIAPWVRSSHCFGNDPTTQRRSPHT